MNFGKFLLWVVFPAYENCLKSFGQIIPYKFHFWVHSMATKLTYCRSLNLFGPWRSSMKRLNVSFFFIERWVRWGPMKPAQVLRAANDFIDKCERRLRTVHSTWRDLCVPKLNSLYMVMRRKRRFQIEMEVTTLISILQHLMWCKNFSDTSRKKTEVNRMKWF